jgi:hypothetical protein
LEVGLIAMQKVEGSNPFSRFARNLALGWDFVVYGGASGISGDSARFRLALGQRRSYGRRADITRPSGVLVYREELPNGEQVWVNLRNGKITNGGVNETPR